MTPSRQTICLNMIVKDEAPVIRRCLDSVRPLIDHWVIVDTGSVDGTQEIIRDYLKDIPGELYERPWVDFAHNRSEAFLLAKHCGDYVFTIDADEIALFDPGFTMPDLTCDSYNVQVRYGGCTYVRKQLVRNALPWSYQGVVHEYITCPGQHTEDFLPGVTTVPRHDGARARDPQTYRRDALALERALLSEPANARHVFYLAQSYRDAGDLELALRNYRKRVELGGWREEVWYSLYQIASLQERMEKPWPEVMEAYLTAHQFMPDRAGPLFRIAMHYQSRAAYHASYVFLSRAGALPMPSGYRLFLEPALYEYQIAVEHAVAAHYAGELETAVRVNNEILAGGKLPAQGVEQVIRNRRFSVDALTPKPAVRVEPGPLRVVVVFNDPGAAFDDCVDMLLRQDCKEWQAVFIDNGSSADHAARLPLDDPRVSFVRYETPRTMAECVADHLRDNGDPDLVVFALSQSDRLAATDTLTQVRVAFTDPGCWLAYGQNRASDGKLGSAAPASNDADFRARGAELAGRSPLVVRARAAATPWETAGFNHTRFLDAVWTVAETPVPRPAPATIAAVSTVLPMISCLMVTLDRLSLAKRAIQSYADQTYPNRELVIVTDGTPRYRQALERYVASAGIEGVRIIVPSQSGLPLGLLRNRSLAEARGEIACQWDDDDCSHPNRLQVQAGDMLRRNARASFMTDHLQLLTDQRVLCWIDWTLGGVEGPSQLAPGTLMMYRDPRFQYPETGPMARQGEDSVLLARIYETVPVASLGGAGHLYLYQFHGRNTFSREHHYHLSNFRTPAAHVRERAETLREAIAYYGVAKPVVVVGKEGPVFAVS
jgi:glycosyltransferase involved in cell wall biosynthesis